MNLSDGDIREFAALWKQEFSEDLSEAEARQQAALLLELYTLLSARPARRTDSAPPDASSHVNEP